VTSCNKLDGIISGCENGFEVHTGSNECRKICEAEEEYEYEISEPVGEKIMQKLKQKAIYNDGYHPDTRIDDSDSEIDIGELKDIQISTLKRIPSPKKSSHGIENQIVKNSRMQLMMRSKMYYSSNKHLLEGIIARKLTKKKLQEAKEAKEYDIFNESKNARLETTET
jgi:hypothetical protein